MKRKRFVQVVDLVSPRFGVADDHDYTLAAFMTNFRKNAPKCRRVQIIFIENNDGKADEVGMELAVRQLFHDHLVKRGVLPAVISTALCCDEDVELKS